MRTKRHKRRRVLHIACVDGSRVCSHAPPNKSTKSKEEKGVPFSTPPLASDLHFVYNNPQNHRDASITTRVPHFSRLLRESLP